MADVARHRGHPDLGPLPPLVAVDLGDSHREAVPHPLDDGLEGGTLGLEGTAVGDVEVELEDGYVRGISRSS